MAVDSAQSAGDVGFDEVMHGTRPPGGPLHSVQTFVHGAPPWAQEVQGRGPACRMAAVGAHPPTVGAASCAAASSSPAARCDGSE